MKVCLAIATFAVGICKAKPDNKPQPEVVLQPTEDHYVVYYVPEEKEGLIEHTPVGLPVL